MLFVVVRCVGFTQIETRSDTLKRVESCRGVRGHGRIYFHSPKLSEKKVLPAGVGWYEVRVMARFLSLRGFKIRTPHHHHSRTR